MFLSYRLIQSERQWKAVTGLSQQKFEQLSSWFGNTYEQVHGYDLVQLSNAIDKELVFKTYKDCLFYVLYSLKTGLTFDCLGLSFGLTYSAAQKNFKRHLQVLKTTLETHNQLPNRHFDSVEDFEAYVRDEGIIIIDVSE